MSQPSEIILAVARVESISLSKSTKSKKNSKKQRRQPLFPVQEDDGTDNQLELVAAPLFISIDGLAQMATPIRLLVCSIGNPAPYLNTFHSAGHTVLSAIQSSLAYPPFLRDRSYGSGVISSQGSGITLWQSKSLMNISGAGVSAAWRQFQRESRGEEVKLVVVHDELELALGEVKVRDGRASAKGHNGLKDIAKCLPEQQYKRIAVGIGRPESRDPNVVAGYVLRKMNATERTKIESASLKVEAELRKMQGV